MECSTHICVLPDTSWALHVLSRFHPARFHAIQTHVFRGAVAPLGGACGLPSESQQAACLVRRAVAPVRSGWVQAAVFRSPPRVPSLRRQGAADAPLAAMAGAPAPQDEVVGDNALVVDPPAPVVQPPPPIQHDEDGGSELVEVERWWFNPLALPNVRTKPPAASTIERFVKIRAGTNLAEAIRLTMQLSIRWPVALERVMQVETVLRRQRREKLKKMKKRIADRIRRERRREVALAVLRAVHQAQLQDADTVTEKEIIMPAAGHLALS